jgi:hypothetical protein
MSASAEIALRVIAAALWLVGPACRDQQRTESQGPARPTGFRLASVPAGAQVWLDGVARGTTPFEPIDVSAGLHLVRLELTRHEPWETQIGLAPGRILDLPPVALQFNDRQPAFFSEPDPIAPLPDWPKDRFPSDLEIVWRAAGYLWHYSTTLRATSSESGEVTIGRDWNDRLSCTYPIGRAELARLDWRKLVETIEAGGDGEPREPPCFTADCRTDRISLRAFGRMLSDDAVNKHDIGPVIVSRLKAVTDGDHASPQRRACEKKLELRTPVASEPLLLNPYPKKRH